MSQTSFIMGIVIMIGVISFSLFYVSNNFYSSIDQVSVLELKESSKVLENKIYDLTEQEMKMTRMGFEDYSGSTHQEAIVIDLDEDAWAYTNNVKLYYGNPVMFNLQITPDEIKFVDIISDNTNSVSHNHPSNTTVRYLDEKSYFVLSEELCNLIDYNETREEFNHNFKIKLGNCEIGLQPPEETVIARNIPVILNNGDEIKKDFLNILVW